MTLGGKKYEHGVGTHANSQMAFRLHKGAEKFSALVGLDDSAGPKGSVVITVLVDGIKQYESGIIRTGDKPQSVEINLMDAEELLLVTTDARDGITSDMANCLTRGRSRSVTRCSVLRKNIIRIKNCSARTNSSGLSAQ